jgi:hypothetical protein
MQLAIIDDNGEVVVEYSEEIFRKLLIKYFEVHKDIDKAFNQLSEDLRDKVNNK